MPRMLVVLLSSRLQSTYTKTRGVFGWAPGVHVSRGRRRARTRLLLDKTPCSPELKDVVVRHFGPTTRVQA